MINWTRVILGGLLAGLIINVFEYVVNGLVLADRWEAALKELNRFPVAPGANTIFIVAGFLIGLYALWLYVTIRPRFGPGPKTATIAGIATWVPAYLIAMMGPAALHLFRRRLIAIGVAVGFVEIIVGAIAGAALYKEREPAAATSAGR